MPISDPRLWLISRAESAAEGDSSKSCTILPPMKSFAKWWLAPFVAFLLLVTARAEPISQLKPTGYVNDFAHVLDQNTIAQITDICQQMDQKAHAQIAVVTVRSLDSSDVETYAVDLFKQWGIGGKSSDRGVLILYAIEDHRARVEVGYGLEPILPDGKVGGFQREAIPLMRVGQYGQAILLVTARVAQVIADDAKVEFNAPDVATNQQRPRGRPDTGLSLGGIVLIGIVILVVLMTPLRSVLFWMLFSGMFGGGGRGGGWGGGGFGGGGGGFGGFGGGSSGGGGASSSW
jgi:uncharacterized protein